MQSCTCSYDFSPYHDYQARTVATTYTIVVYMLMVVIGNCFMTIHVNVSYACKWLTLDDTSDTDLHAIRYYSHIESRYMIHMMFLTHTLRQNCRKNYYFLRARLRPGQCVYVCIYVLRDLQRENYGVEDYRELSITYMRLHPQTRVL